MKPTAREHARSLLALLGDPRLFRSRLLATLTRAVDGYLRSPVFLVCMRYGLAATIGAQSMHATGLVRKASGHPSPGSSPEL